MHLSKYRNDYLYFVKLYDSFINGDEIKWVESQEHGAEIVLMFFSFDLQRFSYFGLMYI